MQNLWKWDMELVSSHIRPNLPQVKNSQNHYLSDNRLAASAKQAR